VAETQKDCELVYELESPFVDIGDLNGEVHVKKHVVNNGQHRHPVSLFDLKNF
jgi:hypothetical protein